MPIGTPVAIGTTPVGGAGANPTITTTGAAPTPSRVIICVGWAATPSVTVTGLSGGGLSWAVDFQQPFAGAVPWGYAVCSAHAPAGLASSTVITVQFSLPTSLLDSMVAAAYCEGLLDAAAVDVTDGQGQTTATNWDTTSTNTTYADTLVIGGSLHDAVTTNTETGGASELHDFQNGTAAWSMCVEYKILSATGPASLTGTWAAGSVDNTNAFVAYKGTAAPPAGDTETRRFRIRHSRMTSW